MSMSVQSRNKLVDASAILSTIAERAAAQVDLTVIETHRELAREQENIAKGTSHLKDPSQCLHCHVPADAVDMAQEPIDWNDTEAFARFALEVVKPIVDAMIESGEIPAGKRVRWLGATHDPVNWTRNKRGEWVDMDHFEVIDHA